MDDFVRLNPVGHDPGTLENVYKVVLYSLPDAVVRFALPGVV